jgi:hypothetical protein
MSTVQTGNKAAEVFSGMRSDSASGAGGAQTRLPSMGGASFVFEGYARGFKAKTDEKSGEIIASGNVAYMGGEAYIRLKFANQLDHVKRDGCFVRIECEVRKFKDQQYAGAGVVTHVDGKPVTGVA